MRRTSAAVAITLFLAAPAAAQAPAPSRSWTFAEAPDAYGPAIRRAGAMMADVHGALLRELQAKLDKGGPALALRVCHMSADPLGDGRTLFTTETRAVATDATARRRFRVYWSLASPGIWLIRRLSLGPLKENAERHAALLGA